MRGRLLLRSGNARLLYEVGLPCSPQPPSRKGAPPGGDKLALRVSNHAAMQIAREFEHRRSGGPACSRRERFALRDCGFNCARLSTSGLKIDRCSNMFRQIRKPPRNQLDVRIHYDLVKLDLRA